MMDIVRIPVGPLQANAYLVVDDAGDAVVVDPGDEGERIAAEITRLAVAPREVWLTHAHFDHVGGLAALLRAFPLPVRMHDADRPLLEHAERAAAGWGFAIEAPPTETVSVTHGQTLRVGAHGPEARALHTPGHAPGHLAFHLAEHGVVIAGDALFRGSIGRTDLPFGDPEQLLASIRRELLTLPDDTRVLPGHGPDTTIGVERRTNPYLRG